MKTATESQPLTASMWTFVTKRETSSLPFNYSPHMMIFGFLFVYAYIYLLAVGCMSMPGLAEDSGQSALSFYHVDSENQTQVVKLSNNSMNPLSHLASPATIA